MRIQWLRTGLLGLGIFILSHPFRIRISSPNSLRQGIDLLLLQDLSGVSQGGQDVLPFKLGVVPLKPHYLPSSRWESPAL